MGGRLGPDIRAVFFRGHSIELGLLVEGIPSEPLRDITAREVREDGELLVDQVGWSRMPQHHAHPNGRIHEDLPAVLMADDPVVYEANVTDHIAVDHWHHLQTDAALQRW